MEWFLTYMGFIWIGIGSAYIMYTRQLKDFLIPIMKNTDRKILAAIPMGIGILLILSAPSSIHSWFIRALGILGIIKGLIFVVAPKAHYEMLIDWYFTRASDQTSRLFGIIAIIIGTAILSWTK